MNATEIKRIIGDYCEQLYANNLDNPEEMAEFLETSYLLRISQEEIESHLSIKSYSSEKAHIALACADIAQIEPKIPTKLQINKRRNDTTVHILTATRRISL